jgi:uncharacterized iron-regulated membrane protein
MIQLSPKRSQTMMAIHGWAGIPLGLLLYVVLVTGMTAVFSKEIGDWSSPWLGDALPALSQRTHRSLQTAADSIDPSFHEAVAIYPIAGDRLWAYFHRHEVAPDGFVFARGVGFEFDRRDGSILSRLEGTDQQVTRAHETIGLQKFLVDLHVSLHIPFPWGMLLTGALGLTLLVLTISGLFVHRYFIKELFTLRRRVPRLLTRDLHAVAGSWNLPFAILLAFTGGYLSLFVPLAQPVLAEVGYGGDQTKLFELFEAATLPDDSTPAQMSDIDAMLLDARRRSGTAPQRVDIHHWGRKDATVLVAMAQPERGLRQAKYIYAGATGAFITQKPGLGKARSAGGATNEFIGALHFGRFAGTASKAVWFSLAFCLAYVTLSGLLLWVQRRQEEPLWRKFGVATIWVGYGLPAALVCVALAYFVARAAGAASYDWMLSAYLGSAALAALACLVARDPRRLLLNATGVILLALPLVRWLSGGPSWSDLADNGLEMVIATDIAIILGGGFALRSAQRATKTPAAPLPASMDARVGSH